MTMLTIINSYIKYLYYLLVLIVFICLIALGKALKPLSKTIEELVVKTNSINEGINDINKKVEKIKYTLENSLPLFGFILFAIIVIIAAIKDYHNTKLTKKNIVKSTVKQYNHMNLKFNPKRTKRYRKAFISEIKKLA